MREMWMLVLVLCCVSPGHAAANPEVFYQNNGANRPVSTTKFDHNLKLDADGNFWIFWTANDTHITIETHVNTKGYVGFGLSPNGKMFPSDVVVGWVDAAGNAHLYDYHTVGHSPPVLDTQQDWTLIQGKEDATGTILTFYRKLDTCDKNDMAINDDTSHVIFAYHDNDPVSSTSFEYHGSNRGAKSLLFLSSPLDDQDVDIPSNTHTFDVLNKNFHVPAQHTTYRCTAVQIDLHQKHHIVKYEPVIQPGNEMHVHHILIYGCDLSKDRSQYDGSTYNCYDQAPGDLNHCRSVFIAWAIGGGAFYYPPNTGMSIGTSRDPNFFVMETHYDNPTMRSDIVDASGIRFYHTPTLRFYDVGLLEVGVHVGYKQMIPPHEKEFKSQGFCPAEILNHGITPGGVQAFAILQHSHLLGRSIRTRHYRNQTELEPIAFDQNYDFDYQEIRSLRNNRLILPGDSLEVECIYDSTGRSQLTEGGLSTTDEMCLSFILYYPRMSLDVCISTPTYQTLLPDVHHAHVSLSSYVSHMNWTDPNEHVRFSNALHNSPYHMHGFGNIMQPQEVDIQRNEVRPTVPYVKPRTCSTA